MSAVLNRLRLVDRFQDFAVDLAVARQQLQALILQSNHAFPSKAQRLHAFTLYTRLSRRSAELELAPVCDALQDVCDLLDPHRIHTGSGSEYRSRLFALGCRVDHVTRDVAMFVSQSGEWAPLRPVDSTSTAIDTQLLLDNGARAATDMARRLGRMVRVRIDQTPVTLPSLLLPVFHRMVLQLARNAVVHGVEDTRGRRAAGKPATAVINLAVRTEGPLAVLQVKDDGRGVQLRPPSHENVPCGSRLWKAIAAPGYSTASEEVRPFAGRGVGLTAIENILQRLGGYGEARTWAGHGTHVRVCLPTDP